MNDRYFLTTARLGFRPWTSADRELAHALWGDPNVTHLIDARPSLSEDDTTAMLMQHCAWQEQHGIQYWPLFLLSGGSFVGCCGLRPEDPSCDVPELGFHIRASCWRKGYAREAAGAVVGHAFGPLAYGSLVAGHHPENHASAHILAALGFEKRGEELYPPTGLNHPTYILTKEKYLRARA